MRAIVRCVRLFALFGLLSACASQSVSDAGSAGSTTGVPDTEDQKILNALGQALAQSVGDAGLSAEELVFVQRGLSDAVLGQDALVELPEYGPKIQDFMNARAADVAEDELALANVFVEEQARLEGAERTESGIIIQEVTAGTGPRPTAEDTVQVHYHGTLRDGTVFDSSVDRNEPATFALAGVIPCWTEGLQQISVGGKSRLVCPPDLAYGRRDHREFRATPRWCSRLSCWTLSKSEGRGKRGPEPPNLWDNIEAPAMTLTSAPVPGGLL